MSPINSMFSNLINNSSSRTGFVLEQAYAYADKVNDIKLLETIASYVTLGSELDKLIASRSELSVLKIWAGRTDRPIKDISKRFSKENRSTLLLGLAALEGMPESFYTDLAKRKSIHLSWILVANNSVSSDLRLSLAADLGEKTNVTNRSVYARVEPLKKLPIDLVLTFINNNTSVYVLRVAYSILTDSRSAAHFGDREKISIAVFESVSKIAVTNNSLAYDRNFSSLISSLFSGADFSDSTMATLESRLESLVSKLDSDSEVYCLLLDKLTNLKKRRETDFDQLLEDIRLAPDRVSMEKAYNLHRDTCYSLGVSYDSEKTGRMVLSNVNIDHAIFRSKSTYLTESIALEVAIRSLSAKDYVLADEVFARSFNRLNLDLFSKFFELEDDKQGFVQKLIADSKIAPSYMLYSQAFDSDKSLSLYFLPADSVLKNSAYAKVISENLNESFGDNTLYWETFTSLAPEWSGTLIDLVSTAKSLAPTKL